MEIINNPIKVPLTISTQSKEVRLKTTAEIRVSGSLPDYGGVTYITPSAEQQILETKDRSVYSNIVIAPIPNNYGLITWNGAYLTVS